MASEKITAIIESVKGLTVLELKELIDTYCEEFGVSAVAAAAPAAAPAPAAGAEVIAAPMPGTILSVNVAPGQSVRKGDVLMVLEAMKMENEIMCPRDGVVSSVQAAKGAAVESGTLLCVLQ